MRKNPIYFLLTLLALFTSACGGGGGGGGSSAGGSSGNTWLAQATVTKDTCGERISPVTQTFTISKNGGNVTVNSGISTVTTPAHGKGVITGFTEVSGNCTRTYAAEFLNISASSTEVTFTSTTDCGGSLCSSEWKGTAQRIN